MSDELSNFCEVDGHSYGQWEITEKRGWMVQKCKYCGAGKIFVENGYEYPYVILDEPHISPADWKFIREVSRRKKKPWWKFWG